MGKRSVVVLIVLLVCLVFSIVSVLFNFEIGSIFLVVVNLLMFTYIIISFCKYNKYREKHSKFVTNSMHALKGPLMKMKGYTELISMDIENVYFEKLDNEVDQLEQLIQNLIKLSVTIETSKVFEMTKLCLTDIVNKEYETFKKFTTNKIINTKIEEDVWWEVKCDNFKILVLTLIENQIKYSINNIGCVLTKNYLSFINDTNLEDGNYDHLFSRFLRNNNDTSGFGVGLASVKEIVVNNSMSITANVVNGEMTINITK